VLIGDRIQNSDYQLVVGKESRCNVLCEKTLDAEEVENFVDKIGADYSVSWVLDGLPAAVRMVDEANNNEVTYERGFPLGFVASPSGEPRSFLFNHIEFIIQYNEEVPGGPVRIVGFEVVPMTVKHAKADEAKAGYAGEWQRRARAHACARRRVRGDARDLRLRARGHCAAASRARSCVRTRTMPRTRPAHAPRAPYTLPPGALPGGRDIKSARQPKGRQKHSACAPPWRAESSPRSDTRRSSRAADTPARFPAPLSRSLARACAPALPPSPAQAT